MISRSFSNLSTVWGIESAKRRLVFVNSDRGSGLGISHMKGPLDRTKVVVRHLPSTISEAAFLEQIDTVFKGRYTLVKFRPGKNRLGLGFVFYLFILAFNRNGVFDDGFALIFRVVFRLRGLTHYEIQIVWFDWL